MLLAEKKSQGHTDFKKGTQKAVYRRRIPYRID